MPVALYMDVHVPMAITEQLRRRGVDVLTVIEDGLAESDDEELLTRARELGRVIFTQDVGFRTRAEAWQRTGRTFGGLLFGHQLGGTIGDFVRDLQLVAQASDLAEWESVVEYLPFRRAR